MVTPYSGPEMTATNLAISQIRRARIEFTVATDLLFQDGRLLRHTSPP
jgi:hypothetical protein